MKSTFEDFQILSCVFEPVEADEKKIQRFQYCAALFHVFLSMICFISLEVNLSLIIYIVFPRFQILCLIWQV